MFSKINFDKVKPYFDNGDFKWYIDEYFREYINNKQAENLPKLENLGCFIVKGNDIEDYVLINNKQEVIKAYTYSITGFEQMVTFLNMLKITKNYDEYEKGNV